MTTKVCRGLSAAAVVAVLAAPGLTGAELGDPAPALQVSKWLKGGPVDLAQGKGQSIVVVEFWATWCPPCRQSIPHLTELQKKLRDKNVVFVGISSEKEEEVAPFVTEMGDQMDYAVALDPEGATSQAYMEAFGVDGIPHAFVVDRDRRIVWHGHPMADLEPTLEDMVAGRFDLAKAKRLQEARAKLAQFRELCDDETAAAKAAELAAELKALDHELGGIEPDRSFDPDSVRKEVKFGRLLRQYQKVLIEGQDEAALEPLAKQMEAVVPPGFDLALFRQVMHVRSLFVRYMQVVSTEPVDEAKAAALGKQLENAPCRNPRILNDAAWALLTDERIKKRDLALASRLAKAAFDACDGKDAAIVDTYARALFDTGRTEAAIEHQKQALALCDDADERKELEAALKRYQEKLAPK